VKSRSGRAEQPGGKARLGFARGMIDHAYENQRLFRALVGKRSGQIVLTQRLPRSDDAISRRTIACVRRASGGSGFAHLCSRRAYAHDF
jgi:hypothetical protein